MKAIYSLSSDPEGMVSTNAIAERLQTQASSVTDMVKRLAEKDLVEYKRYQGVRLSVAGLKHAVSIIRKHRLWETFLVEKLGFGWDEVHDLAEQLEHIQSGELTNRLDAHLGFPTHDPHGDPIPNELGEMEPRRAIALSDIKPGETVRIVGVKDSSSEFLKYLDREQVALGSHLEVLEVNGFDQSVNVRVNGGSASHFSRQVTHNLFVKRV